MGAAGLDVHSPRDGFWYSHQGWIFDSRWDASPLDQIRDFSRYPELVWGFDISTVLSWHATYSINSLAHRWGTRRYGTSDTSRNNALLALLTLGEGWHNHHHHYCASTRQGFFWWEIDVSYYLLRGLAAVGLIWDVREPPAHVVIPSPAQPAARVRNQNRPATRTGAEPTCTTRTACSPLRRKAS